MKTTYLTLIATLALFQNSFAQWTTNTSSTITSTNNTIGIGTSTPQAVLDVGTWLNPGDLGAVLGRLGEGNTSGSGTFLGVRGYATQGSGDIKSFSLEHSFYGTPNSSINFFRGGGITGGFMSFNTNNNSEAMRITSTGNVSIGTTTPYASARFQTQLSPNINLGIDPGSGAGSVRLDAYNDAANANIPLEIQGSTVSLFGSSGALALTVNTTGNIGINTTYVPSGYQLAVNGAAIATAVTVQLRNIWPDYVFKKSYRLRPLSEVQSYIDQNQHLPDMPAAAELEKKGLNLGEMNAILTKKIEELTLYLIEKDKQINDQKLAIKKQQQQINQILQKIKN